MSTEPRVPLAPSAPILEPHDRSPLLETTLTLGRIAARLKTGKRQTTTTRLQELKRPRQTGK